MKIRFLTLYTEKSTRGIGNLFGIPIAISIGRRMVFLGATVLLVVSSIICAYAKSYTWHLSARCVLALAAGQSEALVPMMTQVRNILEFWFSDINDQQGAFFPT